jgi:uncharacterized protein
MTEFGQAAIEALRHYVYRLEDPRLVGGERTFYVGKGQGDRAFQHAEDALDNDERTDKLECIRAILAAGLNPRIIIHRHGLDEVTAIHVEAALIDAYGLDALTNEQRGHGTAQGMMTAAEVIELYAAEDANVTEPTILIKIEREWKRELTPEQLYERTRRYWVARPLGRAPSR